MKSEQFIYFQKKEGGKLLAVKIADERKDSQAFIYDVTNATIEKEYSGTDVHDGGFLSWFGCFDETGYVNIVLDNGIESWKYIGAISTTILQYPMIEELLEQEANEANASAVWKTFVKNYFDKIQFEQNEK